MITELKLFALTVHPHGLASSKKVYATRELAVASIKLSYEQQDPDSWSLHEDALGNVWVWDAEHPEAPDANPAVYGQPLELRVYDTVDHL